MSHHEPHRDLDSASCGPGVRIKTEPQETPQVIEKSQNDFPGLEEPQASTSKQASLHVSVERSWISSTTVQEGDDELGDLGVEVYDQQTYEKGVFEQVNQAISVVDHGHHSQNNLRHPQQSSKITDLMRIIHDQSGQDAQEEPSDAFARDEQVLQLTRLERLNRNIKIEAQEPQESRSGSDRFHSIRIPRLSRVKTEKDDTLHTDFCSTDRNATKISSKYNSDLHRLSSSEEQSDDDDHSSLSEYKPPGEADCEAVSDDELDDEDIDYESSTESGHSSDGRNNSSKKMGRKRKKLEDDGDFRCYQTRIKAYSKLRAQIRLDNILEDGTEFKKLDEMVQVEGSLQIPKELWDNLFEHQRTGVRWLWELHQLGTGGILGDEMGLGKTIQTIAFLTALRSSNLPNSRLKGYDNLGPTVLVCPATVMHQWLLEFRKWWPSFRVAILHNTGTFSGDRKNLIQVINKSRGILIVSYPGVVIYQDSLHNFDWHYAILDEGHKIRNPDAQVTLACKRFRTPHRLILSGSPVQNNLKELWSIFDFIYPGKLGTLPVFMEQFATPITQGGYANASDFQVQIAYKCSCVLRDTIKPFLLRRTKAEVNHKLKLPDRSEQVLFCKLTEKQRKLYQAYLDSPTVRDIKGGYCQIFVGLIALRKICNHPDLFDSTECHNQIKQLREQKNHTEFFSEDETFGHFKKSGKMMVVDALLKLWKKQEHKVLLFTQSRQMLKIFIGYLNERNYRHLVMDGATPISVRQTMIEEFNTNQEIFIFLLTTRVGGVGINLTGANRIIIYDPDWNPSTDIQARERAWRIGQHRHVIIYRLLTAGTIEEKIYHRQVFKLYLTNRVLKNAQQKRFFKTNDLHELFTLSDNDKNIETKALFDDDLQINPESIKQAKKESKERKKNKKNLRKLHADDAESSHVLSEEKLQSMRERAKRLSQMIALQYGSQSSNQHPGNNQVRIKAEPGISPPPDAGQRLGEVSRVKTEPGLAETSSVSTTVIENAKKRVKYLVRQDIYKPDDSDAKLDDRYKRDDYILERLFKSSNVSGALKHDRIETDSTADFKVVESEAEKVARDAIRALRESRRLCLDSSSGVPNWTGKNGQIAPRPRLALKNKSRIQSVNLSSTSSQKSDSLLSSIKKRNQSNPISLARATFNVSLDSDEEERDKDFEGRARGTGAEDIADKVREFILFKSARSGEAQTDELLNFFKERFKPEKTAIFKAILYKMCEFQRRGDKGFWIIKSEFRDL